MSVGLVVEGVDELVFAQFVLYARGWADAEHLPVGGEDIVCEYVELDDVEEFGPLVDRVVAGSGLPIGQPRRNDLRRVRVGGLGWPMGTEGRLERAVTVG